MTAAVACLDVHASWRVCDECLPGGPFDNAEDRASYDVLMRNLVLVAETACENHPSETIDGDCPQCQATMLAYRWQPPAGGSGGYWWIDASSGAMGDIEVKWDSENVWLDGCFFGVKARHVPEGETLARLVDWHRYWMQWAEKTRT